MFPSPCNTFLYTMSLHNEALNSHVAVAEASFVTSLRSLTLECTRVGCVRSSSLEFLEMFGPGGYMMSVSTPSCCAMSICHNIDV